MIQVQHPPDIITENIWEDRARLLRAMAHPVRLTILEMLYERPRCVKHINSLIHIAQPQLSQHMAALRKENLVACHACGPVRCYYILQPTLVSKMIELLRQEHEVKERDCRSVVKEASHKSGPRFARPSLPDYHHNANSTSMNAPRSH